MTGALDREPLNGSVVTLGAFDGVHRGHQALIARAVAAADRLGVPAIAYTFDPHPAKVLAPAYAPPSIISLEERVRLLESFGVQEVIIETFDAAFSQIEADDWVRRYLLAPLAPRQVVIGFNFSYGKDRGGSPETLKQYGFEVEIVPAQVEGGIVASSTRVREFLLEGNLKGAELLLGRRYAVTGTVVEGDRRGRTIGFPTANVAPDHELVPAHGVYASLVDGHPSVTNVGRRPTFDGKTVTVETHLLDFDADLYGQAIRVELVERIRDERRFEGIEALKAQIELDARRAREILF